ncbi:MAG: hypothetical protein KIT22_11465 [Verrucomicrobiae bacterium]|nr:hypothetical protein [Verrucomicrobiae bacterium]
MMDPLLNARLRPILRRLRWRRLALGLAVCWGMVLLLALALLAVQRLAGGVPWWTRPLLAALAASGAVWTLWWLWRTRPGYPQLALWIERRDPQLKGVLLTAVQQEETAPGGLNFLQQRVVVSALQASHRGRWRRLIPGWQVLASHAAQLALLAVLIAVASGLRSPKARSLRTLLFTPAAGLEITPGDVELEKGSSLVVLARFGDDAPREVEMVVSASGAPERRVPLVRSLSDPVFGASLPDVSADFRYRVIYDGHESPEFRVKVFEYPRLERSDADLAFPAYTALPPKRVEDTRRVSAVEGTQLDFTLQLNKPVATASFVERTNAASRLALEVGTNWAVALLRGWTLTNSARYDLVLVDADGRTNKTPASFVLEALPNRVPELKLPLPRGDQRPSALEEIAFSGTVWDDFGIPRFGLAFVVGSGEPIEVALGAQVAGKDKRAFDHLLRLEELGVMPGDLVSWHLWAEDIGPDGQVRRTESDLHFGEVRPFDEIFREGEAMEGESSGEQQQSTPATRLAELQKQIINATWKLQRLPGARPAYVPDAMVVHDSQADALQQAESEAADAVDSGRSGDWKAVVKAMQEARSRLSEATNAPALLPKALGPEQAAYQALLRMQSRETTVSRARSRGQGGGQAGNQRQLDQLDLKQSEDRYETARQAQSGQSAEQREQLQILNRLQELARRQEDLNERLKEMQTALQEADTEAEREEARRQLKRLQEEQREMLADVDELRQRMDRPENQSRMADERRRLDETRDEVQRAAEAAEQGSTGQAVASGTRAQRQLESLRDELRKETASQFAEEARQVRQDARELARRQEDIARRLDSAREPARRTLTESPERREVAEQLAQQRTLATNLVDRATQLAQQAENAEPLLSQKLEETLRQYQQDDAGVVKQWQQELAERGQLTRSLYERLQETAGEGGQTLEMAADLLRQGNLAQADRVEKLARGGIEQFQQGIEGAAQSVLGDDTEALRRAAGELDSLTSALERELAQGQGEAQAPGQGGAPDSGDRADSADRTDNSASTPGADGAQAQAQAQAQPGSQPGGAQASANLDLLSGQSSREGGDTGGGGGGPLTGGNFAPWSDRLREVEELVDVPEMRSGVAGARERARLMRLEMRRDLKKPDWAVVRLEILKPLVEVRRQIAEELARRGSRDALVPLDRDPVPSRYAELVRRYYEELGKDR